jgi:YD repeat-containing protein
MEVVITPGLTRPLRPQAVAVIGSVKDSIGEFFNPSDCSTAYGRDANGNITTETATDGTNVWIKTYTWVAGVLTEESKWVKQ